MTGGGRGGEQWVTKQGPALKGTKVKKVVAMALKIGSTTNVGVKAKIDAFNGLPLSILSSTILDILLGGGSAAPGLDFSPTRIRRTIYHITTD